MALPSPSLSSQIADELAVIAENGLGRPLWASRTEDDVPYLAALARKGASSSLPLEFQIAAVILPAVRQLREPSKRVALEKLLWIDELDALPEDVGAHSAQRKLLTGDTGRNAQAAAALNYTTSYFERRKRKPLLEDLAATILALHPVELSDQQALAVGQENSADSEKMDGATGFFVFLARRAVNLHFHALVALFVAHFDQVLEGSRKHYTAPRSFVWEDTEELAFEAFVGFAVYLPPSLDFASSDNPFVNADKLFSVQVADNLRKLSKEVIDAGPPMGFDEWDMMRALYEGHLGTLKDARRNGHIPFYEEGWRPWYRANLLQIDSLRYWPPRPVDIKGVRSLGVAFMARRAEEIEAIFLRYMGTSVVSPSEARRVVQKVIGAYYRMDDWRPLINGRSLVQHIDAFIDMPLG